VVTRYAGDTYHCTVVTAGDDDLQAFIFRVNVFSMQKEPSRLITRSYKHTQPQR